VSLSMRNSCEDSHVVIKSRHGCAETDMSVVSRDLGAARSSEGVVSLPSLFSVGCEHSVWCGEVVEGSVCFHLMTFGRGRVVERDIRAFAGCAQRDMV